MFSAQIGIRQRVSVEFLQSIPTRLRKDSNRASDFKMSCCFFTKFGRPTNQPDHYNRLTTKLKKKLKQTKVSTEHFGKVVIIEVPFDLRAADTDRLKAAIHNAAVHSRTTFAVVLANRESNPHIRYHYSQSVTANQTAAKIQPDLIELLNRTAQCEITLDPILGSPYRRSWAEAQAHSRKIAEPNPD